MSSLTEQGFTLDVTYSFSKVLQDDNPFRYHNIILFSGLSKKHYAWILQFMDHGGNVLLAFDTHCSTATQRFLRNCGIAVDPQPENVLDYSAFLNIIDDRYDQLFSDTKETNFIINQYVHVCSRCQLNAHETVLVTVNDSEHLKSPLLRSYAEISSTHPVLYRGTHMLISDDNILATTVSLMYTSFFSSITYFCTEGITREPTIYFYGTRIYRIRFFFFPHAATSANHCCAGVNSFLCVTIPNNNFFESCFRQGIMLDS